MMNLVTRFVEAVEKIAEALMGLMVVFKTESEAEKAEAKAYAPLPTTTTAKEVEPKPEPEPDPVPASAVAEGAKAVAAPKAGAWNPCEVPVQQRYDKDKNIILKETAARLGVDVSKCKTPAQAHQAILDHLKAKAEPAPEEAFDAPPADDWDQAETPAAEREITYEELKKLCIEAKDKIQLQLKTDGAGMAKVKAVLKEVGGTEQLSEIPKEKYAAVYAAVQKLMK